MALSRPNLQIASTIVSNKLLTDFIRSTLLSGQNRLSTDEKYFWSWSSKKEEPTVKECYDKHVLCKSSCRKRVPECPAHISILGEPSKCLDTGYGKPIKVKKTWMQILSFQRFPRVQKQKPSNCPPPNLCPKELTFREYIFGEYPPLPQPLTCRRAYKIKQNSNLDDPRLEDPRYQETAGDVLLYSEPEKFTTCFIPGPQPKPPPPYKPPSALLCKRVSDSVARLDCYCACVPIPEQKICEPELCPVKLEPYKMPYEEMRPHEPKKKIFTCKHGLPTEDVIQAPRSISCSNCLHSGFDHKYDFPPDEAQCAFHEALKHRHELKQQKDQIKATTAKMSRTNRLKKLIYDKETEINLSKYAATMKISSCETKCNTCNAVVPLSKHQG